MFFFKVNFEKNMQNYPVCKELPNSSSNLFAQIQYSDKNHIITGDSLSFGFNVPQLWSDMTGQMQSILYNSVLQGSINIWVIKPYKRSIHFM